MHQGGSWFGTPVQGVDNHFRPSIYQNTSPIVQPHNHGRQFEISPQYLSTLPTFRYVESDEPYTHLEEFDSIFSTIENEGFTLDEAYEICAQCEDMGHGSLACPIQAGRSEDVNQIYGEKNPMDSNTYHPGLRNHLNFSFGNSAYQLNSNFQASNQHGNYNQQFQSQPNYQGNYPRGSYNQSNSFGGNFQGNYQEHQWFDNQTGPSRGFTQVQVQDGLSGQVATLISQMSELIGAVKALTQKQDIIDKAMIALTTQVGQIAELAATREQETLPTDTKLNPQHQALSSGTKREAHVNEVCDLISDKEYVLSNSLPLKLKDSGAPFIETQVGERKPPWTYKIRVKIKSTRDEKCWINKLEVEQKPWFYNLKIKFFREKVKNKWVGSFVITRARKFGEIETKDIKKKMKHVVNGHRLKPYVTLEDEHAEIVDVEDFLTYPPTYSVD